MDKLYIRNDFDVTTRINISVIIKGYDPGIDNLKQNLNSLIKQTITFQPIFIIDGYPDENKYKNLILQYFHSEKWLNPVLHYKANRRYLVDSVLLAYKYVFNPQAIVCTVDMDDYLLVDNALEIMWNKFKSGEYWVGWSDYKPKYGKSCSNYIPNDWKGRQDHRFFIGHLRCIKKWLFDLIPSETFYDDNNEMFKYVDDQLIYISALEMAGRKHSFYLPRILYGYNNEYLKNSEIVKYLNQEYKYIFKIFRSRASLKQLD